MLRSLVGSEMCIRDRACPSHGRGSLEFNRTKIGIRVKCFRGNSTRVHKIHVFNGDTVREMLEVMGRILGITGDHMGKLLVSAKGQGADNFNMTMADLGLLEGDTVELRGIDDLELSLADMDQQRAKDVDLLRASVEGNLDHVKLVSTHLPERVNMADETGYTPLILASEYGHLSIVQVLLKSKADVAAQTRAMRFTALHLAAREGKEEVVGELLSARADMGTQDKDDRTALALALESGHKNVIKLLKSDGSY
eukprot:TRINITY_DN18814_c0_g1_i1.p1 TRINITY_DN18814_c0_g1~~TRINITY_DN18814_c0_g1_i1.p1  ORF type:complete len:253 (+),score=56.33 TRINITY_DN18814_c0_g1_i1:112-870(+)